MRASTQNHIAHHEVIDPNFDRMEMFILFLFSFLFFVYANSALVIDLFAFVSFSFLSHAAVE